MLTLTITTLLAAAGYVSAGQFGASGFASSFEGAKPEPRPDRKADVVCPGARKALAFYRAAYATHRAAMRLSGPPGLVRYGCGATRRRAAEWRERAHAARAELARWLRDQYAWWEWLPDKWRRVATCETRLNWRHDSGTYVSAFGIYRPAYADDAAHAGLPAWDDPGERTPREQYETALSHYRLHGGFSGWGCRGA